MLGMQLPHDPHKPLADTTVRYQETQVSRQTTLYNGGATQRAIHVDREGRREVEGGRKGRFVVTITEESFLCVLCGLFVR